MKSRIAIALLALLGAALVAVAVIAPQAASAFVSTGDGSWVWQVGPTYMPLLNVAFLDRHHGWAVGSGTVMRTSDSGITWDSIGSAAMGELWGVDFVDAGHGWVVGTAGAMFATSDGGATWDPQSAPEPCDLSAVDFVDQTHGWAVGVKGHGYPDAVGVMLATTDGGAHWTQQDLPSNGWLYDVDFIDATHGWAAGDTRSAKYVQGPGVLLQTTDGGAHWVRHEFAAATQALCSVDFIDALDGWAVGNAIFATTDGGLTWQQQQSAVNGFWGSVAFADRRHGWATSGASGTVIATSDGGANWRAQISGESNWLFGVTCTDAHHVWTVSTDGILALDTVRPVPRAPYRARVRRGNTAILRFTVRDTPITLVDGTITIRNAAGRVVKQLHYHSRPANTALKRRFVCRLPRGVYRFAISAVDPAGNRQTKVAVNRLVVR